MTSILEAALTQSAETVSRTMAIEAYKHAPLPDRLFLQADPAKARCLSRGSRA